MTTDQVGHHYVVLVREGVGAGILLATDRSGAWTTNRIAPSGSGSVVGAEIRVDAAGRVHVATFSYGGSMYAVEQRGSWLVTAVPEVQALALTPDDPSGVRIVGKRGTDIVAVRLPPSGWVVDVLAPNVGWLCPDLDVTPTGVIHAACISEAGIVHVTNASGSWTTDLVATRNDPNAYLTPEAVTVDGAGTVSIAFTGLLNGSTLHPSNAQEIASNAGGSWTSVWAGVNSFGGPDLVDLATDASGHRHLLTSGSGLVETTDGSGSWISSVLPLGAGPTIGRLTIDAAGAEMVAAEIGAPGLASRVQLPVTDAGIVILTHP